MTSYSLEPVGGGGSVGVSGASSPAKDPDSGEGCTDPEAEEMETRCDWVVCAPKICQPLARPPCFLVWLCLSGFAQGMLVNGFLNSVLTSIERRFDLQSVETGLIASMFDIGAVLAVVPVTYFGRHYRRSRFVSVGALVLCVGSFVFAAPHFLAGRYVFASPVPPRCYPNGTDYPDMCSTGGGGHHSSGSGGYQWFFWLGQLLHGIGASPFFTLAVAYLDDNLTVKQSGVYLGCYYVTNLVGPACGYLLGGLFLGVYVDYPARPPSGSSLSPSDTAVWVGAWWAGLLISGAAAFAVAWPLFGFPKRFAKSEGEGDGEGEGEGEGEGDKAATGSRRGDDESHGDSADRSAGLGVSLADLVPSARVLLWNPAFLCLSLAGTASILVVTGLATFGPKLMQHFFHLTASSATLSIGLVLVPCGALGLLSGALTIRCLDLSLRALLRLNAVASSVGLLLAGCFFVRCPAQGFAGLTDPYPGGGGGGGALNNLTVGCNAGCHCLADKYMFAPVCDATGLQFYSACFAGCGGPPVLVDGRRYYSNCSCVPTSSSVKGLNYSVVAGSCEQNLCTSVPLFLAVFGIFMFFVFFITIPTVQATIRVIPAKLKDFGLGLQMGLIRILGSIPAPLLLGRLIDSSCLLWNGSCGERGSCGYYSSHGLWLRVLVYIAGFKALELVLLAAAALVYRPGGSSAVASGADAAAGNVYAVEFKARPPDMGGVDNAIFDAPDGDAVSGFVSVAGSTVDLVAKDL